MSEAASTNSTVASAPPPSTRRRLLAGTGFAAALATVGLPASAATHDGGPDAELIAACREYLRLQNAFAAYYDTLPGDMEHDDPGSAMLEPIPALVEKIVRLRATTPEGIAFRGQCMVWSYLPHHRACQDDSDGAHEDRFQAALLRDLVQIKGTAA